MKKNFRRVIFTISTGYVDLQDWEKVYSKLKDEIIPFIVARGCTYILADVADTTGVGTISFKPNKVNVDILKSQVEQLFNVTVFVEEIKGSDHTKEVKVKSDEVE